MGEQHNHLLWAKRSRVPGDPAYHPLLCHLLDVALVARVMWDDVLSPAVRRYLAAAFGLSETDAGPWIAFLTGLHDLGKASPAFQLTWTAAHSLLRDAGFPLPQRPLDPRATPHGSVTAATLPEILVAEFQLDNQLARRLGTVIGGHHGIFPRAHDLCDMPTVAVGRGPWNTARAALVRELASHIGVPRDAVPRGIDNPAAMTLAGLVSVADWIGSDDLIFPFAAADAAAASSLDFRNYYRQAEGQAAQAMARLAWLKSRAGAEPRAFSDLFPHITPNALQEAVIELARDLPHPSLVIVEAPMGEGKTEAALFLADHMNAVGGNRGTYVAMPTQATSNQMFGRVRDYLIPRFDTETVNLQLLHGHAALNAEFAALRQRTDALLSPREDDADQDPEIASGVVAAEWFTYRKRGLLSPFGVGTIDQALLAVLQTRHVFVRLFGLAGKTVVIDEVHAYDTYMSTLLERLLEWLAALGSPVILLSATLPDARRATLARAYAAGLDTPSLEPRTDPSAVYPRVTWVTRNGINSRHVPASARTTRSVGIGWVDGRLPETPEEPFPLGKQLEAALEPGGCAVVVCNTVGRAQAVYQALKRYFQGVADDGEPELDLLHARFLVDERQHREQRALRRFGKPGGVVTTEEGTIQVRRPKRAVLIATQIVEQSLDLDFDLMVTDLAPADLVLQRAGRLHRHRRDARPRGLEVPRLWICRPEHITEGVPVFDHGTTAVYDAHALLRSWLVLRDRDAIAIPDEIPDLIEAVYDDRPCPATEPPTVRAAWEETRQRYEELAEKDAAEAAVRWIKRPGAGGFIWQMTANARAEDAPDFHQAHQALTRLTPPSVSVVCLFDVDGRLALDPAGREVIDLSEPPSLNLTRRLLARSVTLSDRRVVPELLTTDPPTAWRESALLRHQRLILLDSSGRASVGKYALRLDPELGLVVE
ncbi:CRISPR-associated helicase/endonuclease Cas3 [Sphaerobacter thermophilus]|uniref:CRISPR-associated helicase Cas3 n=1 Tax=Sphaerobacter thermophilus (strain ATCC 49802 / DSM 20745 / KCCM 41009 / NCIMB 13125 / S 6022) TaxID=479434 RepID=D1CAJ4_SPHTD|nr:CRISPR-associated helicase/endonuclease Cas3 [Sphaerobacter thermophilus]ACZ40837.1 CRISPR-associated helicase Cas3 [Sphaerobacter thermophilus DSM 20745]